MVTTYTHGVYETADCADRHEWALYRLASFTRKSRGEAAVARLARRRLCTRRANAVYVRASLADGAEGHLIKRSLHRPAARERALGGVGRAVHVCCRRVRVGCRIGTRVHTHVVTFAWVSVVAVHARAVDGAADHTASHAGVSGGAEDRAANHMRM